MCGAYSYKPRIPPHFRFWVSSLAGCTEVHNDRFRFRPKHSNALQPAPLVQKVSRIFDEYRLTGSAFLDVANAFGTIWIIGLLYKLTLLNFPFYPVISMSSYLLIQTFQMSLHRATYTWRGMRAGLGQC